MPTKKGLPCESRFIRAMEGLKIVDLASPGLGIEFALGATSLPEDIGTLFLDRRGRPVLGATVLARGGRAFPDGRGM